ncbi:MAG: hypothetical protein ABI680_00030 [Chthoniobacteraceae bacterium]
MEFPRYFFCAGLAVFALTTRFAFSQEAKTQADATKVLLPASSRSGARIQFELWTWGADEAARQKIRDLKDGDRVPMEGVPEEVQFRFRVLAPHNGIVFRARSADGEQKMGWSEKDLKPDGKPSVERLYRAQPGAFYPQKGRHCLDVTATQAGQAVGDAVVNIEFVTTPSAPVARSPNYAKSVGTVRPLPKSANAGAPVKYEMWDWTDKQDRKRIGDIQDGARLAVEGLPSNVQFRFRVAADFDAISWRCQTSDAFPRSGWSEANLRAGEGNATHLFKADDLGFFPQIGRYALEVKATKEGQVVANDATIFEIARTTPVPHDTTFLVEKKDWKGNTITSSKPVNLGPLNETPVLVDNDYSFEPQRAYYVINWERFPPFHLHPRFPLVWASRRFTEEPQFGGPLNRGFTTLANIDKEQDNLRISERLWFHYPGQLLTMIAELMKKDPVKYKDTQGYTDHRSAFISAESAQTLGKMCYEGWGVAGWGPYDPGIYGWDEEEMFPPIATKMMKECPEALPPYLMKYKEKVLAGDAAAIAELKREYDKAMAEFVGNTYKGARESAASRGRAIKIWHYGSKAPGRELFMFDGPNLQLNPKTGKYPYEEMDGLDAWFKKGRNLDFDATAYSREIDYFHTDFYFHVFFPQKESMYEKDHHGYVLDDKGRRKFRRKFVEERLYADPVKIGQEDTEIGPVFLKSFIAKAENNMFWFNGGKYYKTVGTQPTTKQLGPYIRPGSQETWGEVKSLGSRPVSPYMAEASTIFTFMMGCEALFVWDSRNYSAPVGYPRKDAPNEPDTIGDMEFAVKGLHRVSQFNQLFDGTYSFIRPTRHYRAYDRDHPIIRGLINGRYLALAMTNPYLDPGEKQEVEIWYDSPYASRTFKWSGKATILSRTNHIFQCKLPSLPAGQSYDPDKLYFRYTLQDGQYAKTFTVTGNYDVQYPYEN